MVWGCSVEFQLVATLAHSLNVVLPHQNSTEIVKLDAREKNKQTKVSVS